ncbi:MAG: signal recognition particle-docking protein FtsY [Holosporales bacterium]|jgi:fused signal recognition particle receptor|nr:signal recognition particle-docking protein FtsY [Holosporales bacterium]
MSFFGKLKQAISKIADIDQKSASGQGIDLEEILIEADFGVHLAAQIASELKKERDMMMPALVEKIRAILSPLIREFSVDKNCGRPFVIVVAGVNGSGKTTTVAKIANFLKNRGFSVDIAACDTFRVAATEQLSVWAERLGCSIFKADAKKDPASVAYGALQETRSDVLIVDTAGRLHNNPNLMDELRKIYRCLGKIDETAPHMNILVIDATTGQNAIEQTGEFSKICPLSGIIMSKMDGNAKGGVIVRIASEYRIPILGIGTGETERDFEVFSIEKFLRDLTEEKV